jgi:hypothetical protein
MLRAEDGMCSETTCESGGALGVSARAGTEIGSERGVGLEASSNAREQYEDGNRVLFTSLSAQDIQMSAIVDIGGTITHPPKY